MSRVSNLTVKPTSLISDFKEITKMRLSLSVVFSSIAGYLLGADVVSVYHILLLSLGGYFMVGASNAFNQIIERDLDALMDRTKFRPIPAGRMSVNSAFLLASLFTIFGIIILYIINPQTAMFGAISIFLYTSAYTPLKTKTPLAVFVGAIPGAIPFMLGWVAATNDFGIEPGTLFMLQFFWQFPHFWAIGWFLHDDYQKAGFNMLPTGKQDKATATQTIMYTVWTIIVSIAPVFGFDSPISYSSTTLTTTRESSESTTNLSLRKSPVTISRCLASRGTTFFTKRSNCSVVPVLPASVLCCLVFCLSVA